MLEVNLPVGSDPDDPAVLRYWTQVARRLRFAPLPDDLEGVGEILEARIAELEAARAALAEFEARFEPIEAAQATAFDEVLVAPNVVMQACREADPSKLPEPWKKRIRAAVLDLDDHKPEDVDVSGITRVAVEARLAGVDAAIVDTCEALATAWAKQHALMERSSR